jgi:hypothetical protein
MNGGLNITAIGLELLPEAIAFAKSLWKKRHPDAPELTDADVKAALAIAGTLSLAKGDAWTPVHPL